MKPLKILDCVGTPDGRELALYQHGDSFLIQIDRHDLMGSRAHGSEEELARLGIEALGEHPAPRVLIGGLGMGFTLRAALDALDGRTKAKIVVAEVFPAVVEWNRSYLANLAKRPLDDPRTEVEVGDVGDVAAAGKPWDAILLDVDNGPEELTVEGNRWLYSTRGLERWKNHLTPGGVLAVWSAGDDPSFTARLRRVGFEAEARQVRARRSKGERHTIFFGRRTR